MQGTPIGLREALLGAKMAAVPGKAASQRAKAKAKQKGHLAKVARVVQRALLIGAVWHTELPRTKETLGVCQSATITIFMVGAPATAACLTHALSGRLMVICVEWRAPPMSTTATRKLAARPVRRLSLVVPWPSPHWVQAVAHMIGLALSLLTLPGFWPARTIGIAMVVMQMRLRRILPGFRMSGLVLDGDPFTMAWGSAAQVDTCLRIDLLPN